MKLMPNVFHPLDWNEISVPPFLSWHFITVIKDLISFLLQSDTLNQVDFFSLSPYLTLLYSHAYLVEKLLRADFSIYSKGRSNQCPRFLKHTPSFLKTHSIIFPPPTYPFLKWPQHTFLWQCAVGPFIDWSDVFHIYYIFTAGLRVCNLAQGLNILLFTHLAWVMFVRGHQKLYSALSIWCFQTHSCFVEKSISTLQNISEFIKLIIIYIGIFSWIIINI